MSFCQPLDELYEYSQLRNQEIAFNPVEFKDINTIDFGELKPHHGMNYDLASYLKNI